MDFDFTQYCSLMVWFPRLFVWWANWWESAGTPTLQLDSLPYGSRKLCLRFLSLRTSKIESLKRSLQTMMDLRLFETNRERRTSSVTAWDCPLQDTTALFTLREQSQVVFGAKVLKGLSEEEPNEMRMCVQIILLPQTFKWPKLKVAHCDVFFLCHIVWQTVFLLGTLIYKQE